MKRQLYPVDNQVRIFIHSGHLSADNGAAAPTSTFITLAEVLDAEKEYGDGYGDDSIVIKQEQLPIALEMIKEDKMLYRVEATDDDWQGVITDVVRNILNPNKRPVAVTPPVIKHSYERKIKK